MRLFAALEFEEHKDCLAALQNMIIFSGARLNFTKSFHLTLRFLGEVQPHTLAKVTDSLRSIKSQQFTLHFGSLGVFPNERNMRVVWIDVNPQEPVIALQNEIDDSLKGLFSKEKEFKAHVTLARVKSIKDKKGFVEHLKCLNVEKKILRINEFLLIKSELIAGGPNYAVMERFTLY